MPENRASASKGPESSSSSRGGPEGIVTPARRRRSATAGPRSGSSTRAVPFRSSSPSSRALACLTPGASGRRDASTSIAKGRGGQARHPGTERAETTASVSLSSRHVASRRNCGATSGPEASTLPSSEPPGPAASGHGRRTPSLSNAAGIRGSLSWNVAPRTSIPAGSPHERIRTVPSRRRSPSASGKSAARSEHRAAPSADRGVSGSERTDASRRRLPPRSQTNEASPRIASARRSASERTFDRSNCSSPLASAWVPRSTSAGGSSTATHRSRASSGTPRASTRAVPLGPLPPPRSRRPAIATDPRGKRSAASRASSASSVYEASKRRPGAMPPAPRASSEIPDPRAFMTSTPNVPSCAIVSEPSRPRSKGREPGSMWRAAREITTEARPFETDPRASRPESCHRPSDETAGAPGPPAGISPPRSSNERISNPSRIARGADFSPPGPEGSGASSRSRGRSTVRPRTTIRPRTSAPRSTSHRTKEAARNGSLARPAAATSRPRNSITPRRESRSNPCARTPTPASRSSFPEIRARIPP